MARGRPLKPLEVSPDTRAELASLARSRSLPAGLVRRAGIVLLCADGLDNATVAERVRVSRQTVGKWRERFRTQGLMGLYDEYRPGRPRTIPDDTVMTLIRKTLETRPPDGGTHWTCRSMADATGVSKSTVQRLWTAFHLQPHWQKHFRLSTDPFFVEKVRDIVGLYLNPPDHALVLCVRREEPGPGPRAHPAPPAPRLGCVEGVTHGCIRHGTTTLFAALDVATGRVLARCKPRHRHQEFLGFLKHIDANVPPDLDVHLVVDNYSTHKHARVKRWLADRPRYHIHFTPPTPPGSTRSRFGSTSSRRRRSAAGPSLPSPGSRRGSCASPSTTTPRPGSSCGPRPPTPSSTRSRNYAWLFPGHNTSGCVP